MIEVMIKKEDRKGWQLSADCWNEGAVRSYIRNQFGLELEDMDRVEDNHFRFYKTNTGVVQIRLEGWKSKIQEAPVVTELNTQYPRIISDPAAEKPWYKRVFKA